MTVGSQPGGTVVGGSIDFEDFLGMMHARMQEVNITEEVIEAFRVFDKERTGFV